ncbi:hypothetical protein [Pseudomonas vancouverensis]|uniref:Uncharacterized protein n=1 Tax=Pseudomonas vancouverensis TaxID=95300 RepID=A0A1H2MVR9_PSEVA|nr:hypothetical protein [Pseudomonas vancouverensis]KAB0489664.1 hypothetical protein F7R09_28505 [Pseudomonas vancouverensis]TDB67160.1 hypothetical protein EIY72_03675 [Pseudomonas vancouverensis]SDU97280.1 hypothetical protein SAMN05216558_1341 [Pseudomonas vancouverensis]
MNTGPLPDPRTAVLTEIERKIAEFFGAGGKAEAAAAFRPEPRPSRSNKIDPDTVLKRRRPSPSHAERIALRRITEAL